MKLYQTMAGVVLAGLMATSAHAGVKGYATRTGNFAISNTGEEILIPLKDGTTTPNTLRVKSTKVETLVITYSAECAVITPATDTPAQSAGRWVHVNILVDGVVINPTAGVNDAFCSGNQTPGNDGWFRASVTTTAVVAAGFHNIEVKAATVNGGIGLHLGDSALVVNN